MTGPVDGPRGCRPEELPDVIRLVDAAMRQGSDQSMRTDYPLVYAPGNLREVLVMVDGGRIVATAPVLPRWVSGEGFSFGLGVISPTATDPAHQHRGYGSACVAACVERMDALALELSVLWTRVATFPFYERLGWQAVARSGASVVLGPDDAASFAPWGGTIARLADHPGRLADVAALHAQAQPGVARSLDDQRAVTSLPRMTTWLALDASAVAGYLVASTAINKPGVLEAAGDPVVVAGLLRHTLEGLEPGASVEVHVGDESPALRGAVERAVPDRTMVPSSGNMMVRLNDPEAFLRAIRGWLAAHWGTERRPVSVAITDADMTVSFDWSGTTLSIGSQRHARHVELTRRALSSVLFGAHPDRPVPVPGLLAGLPTFRLPMPPLDRS